MSHLSSEERWRLRFDLAWANRGMIIDLGPLDDHILEWLVSWAEEAIKKENKSQ